MLKPALAGLLLSVAAIPSAYAQIPDGHQAMLAQLIRDRAAGALRYESLTPELADAVRPQADAIRSDLSAMGPLRSLTFERVNADGQEIYRAEFEKGALEWAFAIDGDGRVSNAVWRPVAGQP